MKNSDITSQGFKMAMDEISDCILMCDDKGRIIYMNRAAERLDGLTLEEAAGKHIFELYELDDKTSLFLRALKNNGQLITNEYHSYVTKHGRKQSSVSSVRPIYRDGKLAGMLGISKDFSAIEELHQRIIELQEQLYGSMKEQKKENVPRYNFSNIIGKSETISKSIKMAKTAAENLSPVLIYGETGTGKEIVAQSIHNAGLRKDKPFLAINCSAIPENLLEGILFGTVKGAFTGAVDRPGLFEQASEGTIFLDELNSMSLKMQSKLLRALEEGYIRRVGDVKDISVSPRVIAALNMEPLKAVDSGQLRKDLFFRLGVMQVPLPPLRERKEDIPDLVAFFVTQYNEKRKLKVDGITYRVWDILYNYSWPGNVRELKHCMEFALNMLDGNEIDVKHLPPHIVNEKKEENNRRRVHLDIYQNDNMEKILGMVEKQIIEDRLLKYQGKITETARSLGMKRQSLEYRLKKYDINHHIYKPQAK